MVEKCWPYLLVQAMIALLGEIHDKKDGSSKVGQRGHGLHFDRVSLFQGVVQNTGCVDDLWE